MKKYLVVTALTILASISSFAEGTTPYSKEAIELLGVVTQCPSEFSTLSATGRVTSATHLSQEALDVYSVQFVAGGYAPTFKTYSVGVLNISRTFQRSTNPAPDAPGGVIVYSCQISK